MLKKSKTILLTVVCILVLSTNIYAENPDSGWNGYGLYNLKQSNFTVLDETTRISLKGGSAILEADYSIKNNTNVYIKATIGTPKDNISAISLYDGQKKLRVRSKTADFIQKNYKTPNLTPAQVSWYTVEVPLKPGEIKGLRLRLTASLLKGEGDTYTLSYFEDRNAANVLKPKEVKLNLRLLRYNPSDIVDLGELPPKNVSDQGEINLNSPNPLRIVYQPAETMILDKLSTASDKKAKAIADAFKEEKYDTAASLCSAYLQASTSKPTYIKEITYIQAESFRQLEQYDNYLKAIEAPEIAQLPPQRIHYKILLDKLKVYQQKNDTVSYNAALNAASPSLSRCGQFLSYWMQIRGIGPRSEAAGDSASDTAQLKTAKPLKEKVQKPLAMLARLGNAQTPKYAWFLFLVTGFVLGFFTGRGRKKNKKGKGGSPLYLYRP